MPTDAYLYDAVRTPFGKYGGALAGVSTAPGWRLGLVNCSGDVTFGPTRFPVPVLA